LLNIHKADSAALRRKSAFSPTENDLSIEANTSLADVDQLMYKKRKEAQEHNQTISSLVTTMCHMQLHCCILCLMENVLANPDNQVTYIVYPGRHCHVNCELCYKPCDAISTNSIQAF